MTLHEKELTEPQEKGIIIPERRDLELYKCNGYSVIDLSEIGTREGQISQGIIDVSGFSELRPIISYWTKGKISTNETRLRKKDKLRLIVASEFGEHNLPKLGNNELRVVLPEEILQGFDFELGRYNFKADEWDLVLTPYC